MRLNPLGGWEAGADACMQQASASASRLVAQDVGGTSARAATANVSRSAPRVMEATAVAPMPKPVPPDVRPRPTKPDCDYFVERLCIRRADLCGEEGDCRYCRRSADARAGCGGEVCRQDSCGTAAGEHERGAGAAEHYFQHWHSARGESCGGAESAGGTATGCRWTRSTRANRFR